MKKGYSRWALLIALIFFTVSSGLLGSRAAWAGGSKEYQLKAAYLYHFTKFVKWPSGAFPNDQASFRLCLLGKDPFGKLLNVISKKQVYKRNIHIGRLHSGSQSEGCHILFVAKSEWKNWPLIRSNIVGEPTLTVGDSKGFAQSGGMVNFIRVRDKIRFEINRKVVTEAGLKMSATMLQVGRVINK
jgi:hypothetical protein